MATELNPLALTKFRTAAGMRKGELAKAVGKAPSYVTDLESGRRNPSPAVLKDIANVLGVEVDELLVEVSDKPVVVPPKSGRDRLVATPAEVAEVLGCSLATVWQMIREQRIPHVKYGRRRVAIPWAALHRWLEEEAERSVGTSA